jgi:hypothetical protein
MRGLTFFLLSVYDGLPADLSSASLMLDIVYRNTGRTAAGAAGEEKPYAHGRARWKGMGQRFPCIASIPKIKKFLPPLPIPANRRAESNAYAKIPGASLSAGP